jgi:hypothetical protein
MSTVINKKWTKEEIRNNIMKYDLWVERSLVAIYRKQTSQEQICEDVKVNNGIGFSAFHVKMGTYMSKWIISGKHLNEKFMNKARNIVLHYTKQLEQISAENYEKGI